MLNANILIYIRLLEPIVLFKECLFSKYLKLPMMQKYLLLLHDENQLNSFKLCYLLKIIRVGYDYR